MSRLRLADGIDYANVAERTGHDARVLFAKPPVQFAKLKLVEVGPTAVRLTEKGWDVADAVAGELIDAV